MRVPLSWLREYVALPADATPEQVLADLVKVGFEEEDVHTFDLSGPIVVGEVLEFTPEPQSNGKTIRWCQVRTGDDEVRGIVCGASNFFVGDKVVVTLPGAVLPGPFPIAARKTYGHVSDGMIASARELGLGEEHSGILRLSTLGIDAPVGTDAIALLGLDDAAVEVNVTPDRGYAMSIRGIAREYSNSTGAAFHDPAERFRTDAPAAPGSVGVTIDDTAPVRGRVGASGFVARVVRGIDGTRPTPAWMVARLTLAGIRSISLPVDITNYVMLELGQPLHGYDLARLSGDIVVRRALPGEKLTTLDERERALHPEDLLITDASGPIGLAGVMGGATTEMGADTVDVLIEAATFDPVSIARTARRHKLPSEASRRFERGVDPLVAGVAAARAVELLVELAGGTAEEGATVVGSYAEPAPILLPVAYATSLIGVVYDDAEVEHALTAIGARASRDVTGWLVVPPSWRPDLTDKASLVEEVARISGYDRIPSVLPVAPPGRGLTRSQRFRRAIAQDLAAAGATEVLAYPFVTPKQNQTFGSADGSKQPVVALANALDATVAELRRSLLPGLIDIARRNLSRGLTDLALYELGVVFLPEADAAYGVDSVPPTAALPADDVLAALNASIPPQPWHVAALFLGDTVPASKGQPRVPAGIADALGAAQQVARSVGVELTVAAGTRASLHPGRTAVLTVNGTEVGYAGELLPALADELDLPRVVAVLELDVDALIAAAPAQPNASTISPYPAATQDVSLVVDAAVPAAEVLGALVEGAGELLEDARFVDDYRGQGVPEGSKSLTFALRFRAADRTLTANEATEAKLAGVTRAAERTGASIRE
ncbi:phenylalanine--tRNA ligase subunit beta [Desertivibrio insolitus]|uniref:phenylalanine--tRNA ligase subunit beta n=1 Tax=Herbiconiux sp. SYSU D00978 TaxID=2812562 RepID=UPI001A9776DB|nr:phenylalanine--tRNA ligase subunit beta [Herbiconiux sp. SYSU D00978]